MKLINEKGKLLGSINVIDFLILAVLLLVIASIGYKLTVNNSLVPAFNDQSQKMKELTVTVRCRNTEQAASALKEKDLLISEDEYADGYIEKISIVPAKSSIQTSDGRLVVAEDPINKDIYVTMKMRVDVTAPVLKFLTQEVRVGRGYYVKTKTTELFGVIDSIELP